MEEPQLVLPAHAARIADINPQRLYSAISQGRIKKRGPDGRYVLLADVRAYIARYGRRSGYKEYKKSA